MQNKVHPARTVRFQNCLSLPVSVRVVPPQGDGCPTLCQKTSPRVLKHFLGGSVFRRSPRAKAAAGPGLHLTHAAPCRVHESECWNRFWRKRSAMALDELLGAGPRAEDGSAWVFVAAGGLVRRGSKRPRAPMIKTCGAGRLLTVQPDIRRRWLGGSAARMAKIFGCTGLASGYCVPQHYNLPKQW